MFQIQTKLPGQEIWWTICTCETPEAAGAVVAILLKNGEFLDGRLLIQKVA